MRARVDRSSHLDARGGPLQIPGLRSMTRRKRIAFVRGNDAARDDDHPANMATAVALPDKPDHPERDCDHPRVVWDTPMAGGNVNGFASEAISLIVPLSSVADIRLQSTFYDDAFVASLPDDVRSAVRALHDKSNDYSLPPPDVFVSQWSPPEEVQHLPWLRQGQKKPRVVSRTMYEAEGLPRG